MAPAVPNLDSRSKSSAALVSLLYPPVLLHPLQSPSVVEPALEVVLCRLQQRLELTPVHLPRLSLKIWAARWPNRAGQISLEHLGTSHCFILDWITPTSAQEDAAPPDVPPFTFFITVQLATTLTVSALEFQNKIPQRLDKKWYY